MSGLAKFIDRDLLALALAAGLTGGLVEGVAHLGLHFLRIDDNSWYPIIWIAAVFNSLIAVILAFCLGMLRILISGGRKYRALVVFLVLLAASLPPLALLLKNWIAPLPGAIVIIGIVIVYVYLWHRDQAASFQLARCAAPLLAGLTLATFLIIEGGSRLVEHVRTQLLPIAEESAPNVLVVVIDTLRADHLSSYGYGRNTSPAIDRLAANGVQFTNAYSSASYTLPSHVTMLTGLYPHEHGIRWDNAHRGIENRTLPEALLEYGYRTGAFSGNTSYFTREQGFGRGFLHFEDFFHTLEDMAWRTAWGGLAARLVRPRLGLVDIPGRKRAPDTNRAVEKWTQKDKDRPFFVMINYMDVHDPYLPPQPFRSMFSDREAPGGLLNFKRFRQPDLTAEQRQDEIDAYDGAIAYADHYLDQLIKRLRELPSNRDLIVIVTSDHGEEFGEHGGYLHGRHLYRETIHVPLVVWGPNRIPAGIRVTEAVSIAALPATIQAFLGKQQPQFAGPSLDGFWQAGKTQDAWPLPMAELEHRLHAPEEDPIHHGSLRSLISQTWQFIEQRGAGSELFDLTRDPGECENLANDQEYEYMVDDFTSRLARKTWQTEPRLRFF